MNIVLRVLRILLAYIAATLAASTILVSAGYFQPMFQKALAKTLGPMATTISSLDTVGLFLTMIIIMWFFSIFMAAPLWLLAIIAAEFFRLRSFVVYVLFGAALGLVAYGTKYLPFPYDDEVLRVAAPILAGIALGFIYWLIAGRRAGLWKGA